MDIHLPESLENPLRAAVNRGQFASVDDAMAEAVRLLLREIGQPQPAVPSVGPMDTSDLGLIGALRDDADLLDQAVEHAMKVREERPWRLANSE